MGVDKALQIWLILTRSSYEMILMSLIVFTAWVVSQLNSAIQQWWGYTVVHDLCIQFQSLEIQQTLLSLLSNRNQNRY